MKEGNRIKILKDKSFAKTKYASIIEKDENGLYWNYSVSHGDTLETITKKYFKANDRKYLITKYNPDVGFKAGDIIKIILE